MNDPRVCRTCGFFECICRTLPQAVVALLECSPEITDGNNDIPVSTCRHVHPDSALLSAMIDIARTPMMLNRGRCDATEDGDRGGKGNGYECGRESVKCPACKLGSNLCQTHMMYDPEYHPQFPEGVCRDCFMSEPESEAA